MKKIIKTSELIYFFLMLFTGSLAFYAIYNHFNTKTDTFLVQGKYIEESIAKDSTLHLYQYIVIIEGKEYTIVNYPNREYFNKIKVGHNYLFEVNNYGGIWLINK